MDAIINEIKNICQQNVVEKTPGMFWKILLIKVLMTL